MMRNTRFLLMALAAGGILAATAGDGLAAESYEIDPVHSMALFKIKHQNVGYVWGRINGPTGKIVLDEADLSKSSVHVELKAGDVDTANEQRDAHLRTPDFFDAEKYPALSFKSAAVKKGDEEGEVVVTGDFTLMGKTKELTVTMKEIGRAESEKGARIGFAGDFKIKRSEFGMDKMLEGIGDEVKITLAIQGAKKPKDASATEE